MRTRESAEVLVLRRSCSFPMSRFEIRIYRRGPHSFDLDLVRTILLEVESEKRLTADRARRILTRAMPEFGVSFATLIEKTDEGYEARRPLVVNGKPSAHYAWEHAVVVDTSAP